MKASKEMKVPLCNLVSPDNTPLDEDLPLNRGSKISGYVIIILCCS